MIDIIESMAGPHGGTVSLSFGCGATAGWTFAMRTALAEARSALAEVRKERDQARDEAREAHARYLQKLEQLSAKE